MTSMLKLVGKWMLWAVGAMAGVFLTIVLVGWTFPVAETTTNTITINRPPQNVWWILTDYNNASQWHPQFREAVMLSLPGDKPMRWRGTYTDGAVVNFEVVESDFPKRLVERIADNNLPFGGTWTVVIRTDDLRTSVVTVQARAENYNPFNRFVVHLFVNPSAEVDRILKALKSRVESSRL